METIGIKILCQETGHGIRPYVLWLIQILTAYFFGFPQTEIAEDKSTHGSMFVPIILGSDKTTVSVATGQNDYYPLYVSIGNIHNNVRRAHRNGVILLGFLAVAKSKAFYTSS
jgi:hypothetical protein